MFIYGDRDREMWISLSLKASQMARRSWNKADKNRKIGEKIEIFVLSRSQYINSCNFLIHNDPEEEEKGVGSKRYKNVSPLVYHLPML